MPTKRRLRHRSAVIGAAATLVLGLSSGAHAASTGTTATTTTTTTAMDTTAAHTVTYDGYSFLIDGKRTYLWSGEFHYFRLPNQDLWRDVLQKMKAAGFNATSLYFDWGYHSPAPGVYDFTGVRDVDKLLDIAQQVGIYVIARPGPYINAEVDGGGFPGWLATKAGNTRSNNPEFLKYSDEWQTQIDRILARHQLTNGTGTVIEYQVENEYYNGNAAGRTYMQHLEDKATARWHHSSAGRQQQRHVQLRRGRTRRRRRRTRTRRASTAVTRRTGVVSRISAMTMSPASHWRPLSSRAVRSIRGAVPGTTSARS